jgi:hypothetical protein
MGYFCNASGDASNTGLGSGKVLTLECRHKFFFARQFIRFGALQHIVLKEHGHLAGLWRHTLTFKRKDIVPAVRMEHTAEQCGAQDVTNLRLLHAGLDQG